jgi:hypothetical protein
MWPGAVTYCNWLSDQNGLQSCYDLTTWNCDFTQNGYRLPTEAEWEYAGRGGHYDPYLKYPNGDTVYPTQTNIPVSGDPYETGPYPQTTPVGFYDGSLKLKADYNWPGNAASYQTSDGANGYGLYDMQGNVWELINDWYGQNYYSISPYDNPTGPSSGFIMPDGKPYRGMRGGNWYNGYTIDGVNDGHSRVSNRNPSYYRGPQDPNHPWYHIGFRVVRKYAQSLGFNEPIPALQETCKLEQNYPNPVKNQTTIRYYLPKPSQAIISIKNIFGAEAETLADGFQNSGWHEITWEGSRFANGIYLCTLSSGTGSSSIKMVLMK